MGILQKLVASFERHARPMPPPRISSHLNTSSMKSAQTLLDAFMAQQEAPMALLSSSPAFSDDVEKWRYINFYFGAVNKIAETLFDSEAEADVFFMVAATTKTTELYGVNKTEALISLWSHAKSDSIEYQAGKIGWETMEIFGECIAKGDVNSMRLIAFTLYDVVKGKKI